MSISNSVVQNNYRALSRKMVLAVLIVSFTPLILISGAILYQFHNAQFQKVQDHITTLLLEHAAHIDSFLNEKMGNIYLLANSYDLKKLKDESLAKDLELLRWVYGRDFEDLGVINQDGKQIAHAGANYFFNPDNNVSKWFQKAIEKYQYVSDIFETPGKISYFFVSVKKMTKNASNDQQTRLFRAGVNSLVFKEKLRRLKVGETGKAYIYNRGCEFRGKPHPGILPGKKILEGLIKEEKKNQMGVYIGELNHDGKKFLSAATYIKSSGWLLFFQQDMSEAFSAFRSAGIMAGIIFFLGGIGIFFTEFAFTRKTVGRLKEADHQKARMSRQVVEAGKLASIGELAAGIAHEINNPVAIMIESAGWVKDLILEEQFEKKENYEEILYSLNQIKEQGLRCKSITEKLLSFARRSDSKITDLHIDELMEDVLAISIQRAICSGIKINNEVQKDLPLIKASRTELEQVFLNLVNNAIDAMEITGGKLTISSKMDINHLFIEFTDTGPGIPPANLKRIFDPFFTTKSVGKGSGLGLSICYGIIEKMSGQIIVKSTLKEETTFIIKLPRNADEIERDEGPQIRASFGL